ncbi:bile acid:sodium symporter family protein [uncultured Sulfitobacter sp.]|uniref:bile acid:sodium symporter family protein n=1 Tax=uncultured Sulfitobacter sp. TaxID=191468 RepID=UPI002627EFD7|nr:bile acid:sodium symporter family protein [uncultured Sulfitobacter sp.]
MDTLISVVLPLGLAFIMFSLGVGLTLGDFLRVGQRPLAFAVGALNQVILLPLVVYLIILAFGLQAEIAVGFMILAACPGGVTSNIISRLAKGDVALSVSLTAVISLTSMITVPLIMSFAVATFMGANAPEVDITATAVTMFALTVVPIMLGLGLRRLFPTAMSRAEPAISRIAVILFAAIVLAALAGNWGLFVENLPSIGPAVLAMLVVLTAVGYTVPRLLGRTRNEAKTISIETGVQNGTLGIAIASIVVGSTDGFSPYGLPSAVYGLAMYLTIIPALFIFRRMD